MSFNNNLDQLYRSVIMDHYKTRVTKGLWKMKVLQLI